MKLFITNLPSFYKINLYNRISRRVEILVVYTGEDADGRNSDFYKGEMQFPYLFLEGNKWKKALKAVRIVLSRKWKEVIVGGWNSPSYWASVWVSPVRRNSVVVESSIFESSVKGFGARLKSLFLRRISKAYASGMPHERLVRALGFSGSVVITKGVGVFNYGIQPPFEKRLEVRRFLYVGRLIEVKNLEFLIRVFNKHPELELDIVGFGVLEKTLKEIARGNVHFLGAIENKELYKYYQSSDVFVLPSLSEPWGLVVEEALNNGVPVMLSNRVGCHEDLCANGEGVVFEADEKDFEKKLRIITDVERYNRMRKVVSELDFATIEERQVECYID